MLIENQWVTNVAHWFFYFNGFEFRVLTENNQNIRLAFSKRFGALCR